jgi:hypothetical protein
VKDNIMNPQVEGAIRSMIIALGGIAGASGYLKSIDWVSIAGAVTALLGLAWSIYSNTTTHLVAQVANAPEVSKVVVTPMLAMAIPSLKVVSR